ncbi:MAG: ComEC/Rec2 family competence protein [Treponema sp.]|nr:ComEC/Rec2 family competence protein [Treponema sp.]
MVKRHISNFLKENPLVIPAAVLALAAYSGFFRINPQHQYRTVFPSARVGVISGTVVENPTKVSGYKNAYRVKIRLNSVGTADGAQGYASGIVETYVPTSLYEIHSPGKLYSAWSGQKQDFLIDCGAKVEFKVVPKSVKNYKDRDGGSKTEFHVTDIRKCDWKCDENSSNEIPFGKFSAAEKLKYAFEKFLSRAAKIRALSRLHFSRLMYAWGNAGGLVLALLSGSREYLPPEAGEAFRNAGLSHILALSGMHLSLFSGLAFFIGKKSLGKRFAPILEIFAVLLFFWFAGKSPSLFRALLFSICATVSALTHKKVKSSLNMLALCFLIHASIFPNDVFELGFKLSYGALAGIICINEFLAKRLCRALPRRAGNSLSQSAGAQFFTIPICLKYFGIFAPGGVLASTVVSPIITAFVYLALAAISLSLVFPFLAPIFGSVLGAFYFAIEKLVIAFARIPKIKI